MLTTVTGMGPVTNPRRRLPQRVYWVRRGVVVLVALALVFGIGKLLGGTGSDPSASDTASTSAARQPASSGAVLPMGPTAPVATTRKKQKAVPLVAPSGTCTDDEVSVLPSVARAWAGGPIVIRLQLSGTQPACTFKVSPESLVVKIASGVDRIWSTQDCPKAVRSQEVVVRSGATTTVPVVWSGRRSDKDCSSSPTWALPGFYHVFAAAYGSTPADVQFEVTRATPRIVTRTPRPRPSPTASSEARPSATALPSGRPSGRPSAKSTAKPTARPTATSSAKSGKGSACGGDNAADSC